MIIGYSNDMLVTRVSNIHIKALRIPITISVIPTINQSYLNT